MKKFRTIAVLLILALTLTACGSSENDSKDNDIKIKDDINIVEKPSDNEYDYEDIEEDDVSDYDPEDDETEYEDQALTENPEDTIYNGTIESIYMSMLQEFECTCDYTGDYYEDYNGNLVPHGYGEITGTYPYSNGNKTCEFSFSGYFEYGTANGSGQSLETFDDHTRQYDGQFKDGNFHGEGRITAYYPGDKPYSLVLEGTFTEGHINGQGKKIWSYENGDYFEYTGELKNGKLDGQGTYTKNYANGNIYSYTGKYSDNKRIDGTQSIIYNDGTKFKYEGEFSDDKYSGWGLSVKIYTNGDSEQYEGEFKDGEFNGSGTRIVSFANCSEPDDCVQFVSDGTFVNGKLSGSNCSEYIYYYDGKLGVAEGLYEDGKFISGTQYIYDDEGNLLNSKVVK